MSWVSVDIETDGPAPGLFSMIAIGAVLVGPYGEFLEKEDIKHPFKDSAEKIANLNIPTEIGFRIHLAPIFDDYDPEALAVSGFSRDETLEFMPAKFAMEQFRRWLIESAEQPYIFVGDNPAFDFGFLSYYFTRYCKTNPFGWSGRRIGDIYAGCSGDARAGWKHRRITPHTHDPLDDARGNAEALLYIRDVMEFKVKY